MLATPCMVLGPKCKSTRLVYYTLSQRRRGWSATQIQKSICLEVTELLFV